MTPHEHYRQGNLPETIRLQKIRVAHDPTRSPVEAMIGLAEGLPRVAPEAVPRTTTPTLRMPNKRRPNAT